jgi:predicted DNA-binding ribbon-helix-helix protein
MMIDEPGSGVGEVKRLSAGVVKRSLVIAGHRTSISLEEAFWSALKALAGSRAQSINALVAEIDANRGGANLSSAIRVFLFQVANRQ